MAAKQSNRNVLTAIIRYGWNEIRTDEQNGFAQGVEQR